MLRCYWTRKDPILLKVIDNYLQLLPENTTIQIFHGTNNENLFGINFIIK